jgi:hypothetical protein
VVLSQYIDSQGAVELLEGGSRAVGYLLAPENLRGPVVAAQRVSLRASAVWGLIRERMRLRIGRDGWELFDAADLR